MSKSAPFKSILATVTVIGASFVGVSRSEAYTQINLVSDLTGLAPVMDPGLVNPWGVSFIPPASFPPNGTPFWVSNQGSGTSTLYAATSPTSVSKVPLTVAIPSVGFPAGPTGQVSNTNTSSFILGDGTSALFMFANLNGTISAWNGGLGTTASVEVTTAGASYTGLAVNQAHTTLYAANGPADAVNVFNSSFAPILPGSFATPASISMDGLVPFNVQDLAGNVYVTYAPPGHFLQSLASPGEGAVVEFSEGGAFEKIVVPAGFGEPLASPWGIALAPPSFGKFGGDLLVGNFSYIDSGIDAIDPTTGALVGTIPINVGAGNMAGGLWTLTFGGGGADGSPNVLYFTDGINHEGDGLFGAIVVPEASTWAMMVLGFAGLCYVGLRRARTGRAAFGA
jgi:uncharacterized protein (TIGR03118 family)